METQASMLAKAVSTQVHSQTVCSPLLLGYLLVKLWLVFTHSLGPCTHHPGCHLPCAVGTNILSILEAHALRDLPKPILINKSRIPPSWPCSEFACSLLSQLPICRAPMLRCPASHSARDWTRRQSVESRVATAILCWISVFPQA